MFYVRADTPNGALPLISTIAEIGVTRKGNQAQQVILLMGRRTFDVGTGWSVSRKLQLTGPDRLNSLIFSGGVCHLVKYECINN